MVHGVARRVVGGGAVGLGAGQRGQRRHGGNACETLQAFDVIHTLATAGGLQAAGQGGDGVVALRLMGNAARVEQAHHLTGGKEGGVNQLGFFFFKGKLIATFTCVIVTIVTKTRAKVKTKK